MTNLLWYAVLAMMLVAGGIVLPRRLQYQCERMDADELTAERSRIKIVSIAAIVLGLRLIILALLFFGHRGSLTIFMILTGAVVMVDGFAYMEAVTMARRVQNDPSLRHGARVKHSLRRRAGEDVKPARAWVDDEPVANEAAAAPSPIRLVKAVRPSER